MGSSSVPGLPRSPGPGAWPQLPRLLPPRSPPPSTPRPSLGPCAFLWTGPMLPRMPAAAGLRPLQGGLGPPAAAPLPGRPPWAPGTPPLASWRPSLRVPDLPRPLPPGPSGPPSAAPPALRSGCVTECVLRWRPPLICIGDACVLWGSPSTRESLVRRIRPVRSGPRRRFKNKHHDCPLFMSSPAYCLLVTHLSRIIRQSAVRESQPRPGRPGKGEHVTISYIRVNATAD